MVRGIRRGGPEIGRAPVNACLLGLALAGVAACSLSQEGVMPPADTLFFPSSAVMAPKGSAEGNWLYVANSNADLRYNDGTLLVMNVGEDRTVATDSGVITLRGAASDRARPSDWSVCPQQDYVNPLPRSTRPTCCWDVLDSNILNCDERLYVQSDATVRIGSFAASMVWQPNCKSSCDDMCAASDPGGARIIVAVRGDTSLTWVDVVPAGDAPHPRLHCRQDGADGTLAECTQKVTEGKSFLFSQSTDPNPPPVGLPDEPFALALDEPHGLLYAGHLVGNTSVVASGGVSLFDVAETGFPSSAPFPPAPTFIAPFNSPFPPNGAGNFGVTALQLHAPLGAPKDDPPQIFVSSRYLPQVATMVPFRSGDQNETNWNCAPASDIVLLGGSDSLNTGLAGSEMRGVAFIDPPPGSDQPQRVFALQRVPPALVSFDVDRNASGALTTRPSAVLETCSSPTYLYETATRLYVNCFDTGEIYVFDPTIPSLVTSFQVGRGPGGMVFDPNRPVAYVLDFSQNDIAVVDLEPGSPTEDHVIQRIGFPSTTPR